MTWMRAYLFKTCASINSLPTLEMADHITVGCHQLQRQLVPRNTTAQAAPTPNYIVRQAQQAAPPEPSKKKTPSERWDLQAASL